MHLSLKNKIILLVLSITVTVLTVQGIITIEHSLAALRASVNSQLLNISSDVANQIRAYNEKQLTILRTLSYFETVCDADVDQSIKAEYLTKEAKKLGGKYENIGFANEKGFSITADGRTVDLSQRDYIKRALNGEEVIVDPFYPEVTNSILSIYAVPVRNGRGKIIGALQMNLNGNAILDMCDSIDLGGGMHPAVINTKTGTTVGNSNQTTEGNKVSDLDIESELGKTIMRVASGETGCSVFTDPFTHQKNTSAFRPVPDCDWSVFCVAPYNLFFGVITKMRIIMGLIIVFSVIFTIISTSILITILIRPLIGVTDVLRGISEGNGDLTVRLAVKGNDEIAKLSDYFNKTMTKILDVVVKIKEIAIQVQSGSQQINSASQSIATGASEQAAAVEEISATIEGITSNIQQTANNTKRTESVANETSEQSRAGGVAVNNSVEAVKQIAEKIQVIDDIASQTNMLALNAAIEAARAGVAGKGFAVVASEVRKLAERCLESSSKIAELSQHTIEQTEEAGTLINAVVPNVGKTTDLIQQIAGACEEQYQGASQVRSAVMQLDSVVQRNAAAAEELASMSEEFTVQSDTLVEVLSIFKTE